MDCRAVLAQQGFLNCTTMITVLIEDCKFFHFQCKDCYYAVGQVAVRNLLYGPKFLKKILISGL